ncbi:hypothetical protein N9F34_03480 [Alphaproteobacteria bacterium]|nr:hypothetical protein [Alphaproteobacteria bacterium]
MLVLSRRKSLVPIKFVSKDSLTNRIAVLEMSKGFVGVTEIVMGLSQGKIQASTVLGAGSWCLGEVSHMRQPPVLGAIDRQIS